ncbi:apolipoprotein N-acyltransferase [Marinomonas sp. TW1]|uniref:apolipoprotein N-acyltransferase n=1 Tax=Marinomonas sp. TW1 TaxID=1561203 RepID=UPI0009ED2AB8|nr:apolipoprotein N-acyltransferase [Marinomonas sp. TW1]
MSTIRPDSTDIMAGRIPHFFSNLSLTGALIIGLIAGAIGVTSFSPFHFWPGYFISLFFYAILVMTSPTAKTALWRGSSVAFGVFASGVSWVFVSIAEYGQVGNVIAALITFCFIAVLSVFWAFSAWLGWHLQAKFKALPATFWVMFSLLLAELGRSVLFTGFPWLLPGYAVENTWLFELLPLGGIWLTSFVVVLTAVTLAGLVLKQRNQIMLMTIVVLSWSGAAYLNYFPSQWVTQTGTLKTTLVQGNVKQDEKWLTQTAARSLNYYQQATLKHLDSDLIVWPETAVTYAYSQIKPYFADFSQQLADSKTTLITGIPDVLQGGKEYYNAIWATGDGFGLYYKKHLVPFGEYLPFADYIGPILDIFGMPLSNFQSGDDNQPVLQAGEWGIAPFICYEIVYPEQVRKMVRDSDLLITISNDGWFGTSFGPWQHLQIAQFRAKETGRYVIRGTNTGITAVINEQGEIVAQAPQFKQTTLTTTAKAFAGSTPYVTWGAWPTLALIGLAALFCYLNSLFPKTGSVGQTQKEQSA